MTYSSSSLTCSSEDLKIKPQSVCVFVGCSSTGKSHKTRSFLLNPDIYFTQPPTKVLYVRRFVEPEHVQLTNFYKRKIEFITWPKGPSGTSLVDYLRPKLPSGGILVLDDVQTDLEKSFQNVMFGTALAHHNNVIIFISTIARRARARARVNLLPTFSACQIAFANARTEVVRQLIRSADLLLITNSYKNQAANKSLSKQKLDNGSTINDIFEKLAPFQVTYCMNTEWEW